MWFKYAKLLEWLVGMDRYDYALYLPARTTEIKIDQPWLGIHELSPDLPRPDTVIAL